MSVHPLAPFVLAGLVNAFFAWAYHVLGRRLWGPW